MIALPVRTHHEHMTDSGAATAAYRSPIVVNINAANNVLETAALTESIPAMERIIPGGYLAYLTAEPDDLYRKYLYRKARESDLLFGTTCPPDSLPLDLSIHDRDDEIVAGLLACTHNGQLLVSLLWVDTNAAGRGLEAQLVLLVEEEARRRGCKHARIQAAVNRLYADLGYITEVEAGLPANVIAFAAQGRQAVTMFKDLA